MKKEVIYAFVGLVVGAATSGFIVNSINKTPAPTHMSMTMADMVVALQGKTGDDFDETFLSTMIEHHKGALDMANLAETNAKHQEVKGMADDILSVQSKEIDMMQTWQGGWGYDTMSTHDMMRK